MFRRLSVRLTCWYTLLFALLSLLAFVIIYTDLKGNLLKRVDAEFIGDGQEYLQIYRDDGLDGLTAELRQEIESEGSELVFFRLYAPDQKLLAHSDLTTWTDLPSRAKRLKTDQETQFETLSLPDHADRTRLFHKSLGDGHSIQVGLLLTDDDQLLDEYLEVFTLAFCLMLLSSTFIGFFTAKRSLSGIERVRQTADLISRGDLSQRIPMDGGSDEIINLTRSFNRMQDRIKALINDLQDVSNNVAHDLRSPVTRMRGLAETTLTGEQTLEEYREMAGAVVEESDRLVSMINIMLEIAEADSGTQQLTKDSVNIAKIVQDVTELYATVAEDKNIALSSERSGVSLPVSGDRGRLQRALANLVDNALKFTSEGGKITLFCQQKDQQVIIQIIDNGIGIPTEELPRVRERFYRGDQSRSTPGNGLGLSLVEAIVHAHGGDMSINSIVKQGTQVTLTFPKKL